MMPGMGMGGMRQGGMQQQPKQLGTGNSAMQASKMGTGVTDDSSKQWWVRVWVCVWGGVSKVGPGITDDFLCSGVWGGCEQAACHSWGGPSPPTGATHGAACTGGWREPASEASWRAVGVPHPLHAVALRPAGSCSSARCPSRRARPTCGPSSPPWATSWSWSSCARPRARARAARSSRTRTGGGHREVEERVCGRAKGFWCACVCWGGVLA